MRLSKEQIEEINDKYLERMDECDNYDSEAAHIDADALLIELLEDLGLEQLAESFDALEKWYA